MMQNLITKKDILEDHMREAFENNMMEFHKLRRQWEEISMNEIKDEIANYNTFDDEDWAFKLKWDIAWKDDAQFYCEHVASYYEFYKLEKSLDLLYDTSLLSLDGEQVSGGGEQDAYGLEGAYKTDFEDWCKNYHWFGKTFQEWIQEKQEYWEEFARDQEETEDEKFSCRHYLSMFA